MWYDSGSDNSCSVLLIGAYYQARKELPVTDGHKRDREIAFLLNVNPFDASPKLEAVAGLDYPYTTLKAINMCKGKAVETIDFIKDSKHSDTYNCDVIAILFTDRSVLKLWDGGQDCCELRYMETDHVFDDPAAYMFEVFRGITVDTAPDLKDEYGEVHEMQFLNIHTNKTTIQVINHNQHNGYYGGFYICAKLYSADSVRNNGITEIWI